MPAQAALELTLDPEKSYEIINGQPKEKEMPGAKHGEVCANLVGELKIYLKSHPVGRLYVETNTKLDVNERIPDISFVAEHRIPAEGSPFGAWSIAPDLAIEIISPNDLHEKVSTKVLEYLDAGVKQVWLVSLENETVTIFRSLNESRVLRGRETELSSDDLLPGFRCRLSEIFPATKTSQTTN